MKAFTKLSKIHNSEPPTLPTLLDDRDRSTVIQAQMFDLLHVLELELCCRFMYLTGHRMLSMQV